MLMYGRYLQKTKRFSHAISPHSSFNLFKNVCERLQRQLCPITRKKDLISMYRGTLVSAFVNILVYFNRLVTNFKPNDRFFKRIQILLIIQTENQSATSSLSDPLLMLSAIHCSSSGDDSRKLCRSLFLEISHSSQCSAVQ